VKKTKIKIYAYSKDGRVSSHQRNGDSKGEKDNSRCGAQRIQLEPHRVLELLTQVFNELEKQETLNVDAEE